jgi:hypothetical protein
VKSAGCVGGNPYILDETRPSGYASSIAFDTNMRPRISYYNPDRKKLRLAICGDTACSAGNVAVDDLSSSPNDIGSENDIAVDQVLNTIYVAAIDRTDNVCTQSLLCASLSRLFFNLVEFVDLCLVVIVSEALGLCLYG